MVRAWVELQRRKRDARHKVSGALGRMRHRELSSALLQWLAYADDQACAPHAHCTLQMRAPCTRDARAAQCTHAARTPRAHCAPPVGGQAGRCALMALCVQHFRMSAAAAAMRTWLARALERRRLGALLRTAATRVSLGLTQP